MKTTLKQIAAIKAGHPFRGAIPENKTGNGNVIQVRDVDEDGQIAWQNLLKTDVSGRKAPDWLIEGEVIFAARGPRNLASFIPDNPKPIVCAPHFFVITLTDKTSILPSFLAWQLNQIPAQRYFRQSAEGSAQVSIRRSVLEQIPLTLPPLQQQQQMVALAHIARTEKNTLKQLLENRRREMNAVAKAILK